MGRARLAELGDASHFYDWGLFLPLCKSDGLSMNCIGPSKPLTVIVKHSNLPMMMFSSFIFPE
jgi:hypothetical protein